MPILSPPHCAGVSTPRGGASLISRRMAASEVVFHLVAHGCRDLSSMIDLPTFSDNPMSQGGFSDVYQGYLSDATRLQVAVKTLRISDIDQDPEHLKRTARELHTWSKCRHPNIVPLLGLAIFRGRIGMVSRWMEKGSLPHYLQRSPNADRHSLCVQICEGLSYLHRIGITHGDLKGANILVSDEGTPALTDFGNSLLMDATMKLTQREGETCSTSLTLRWSAPELITGTRPHTTASDVYALGMTILETISGKHPYYGKSDTTVMFLVVMKKEPPERPEGITVGHVSTDKIWELLLRCWSHEPEARPSAVMVTETANEGA
ncbi:unnamed protein product [Rhizoctonia solani]|uniref:Protein kinase domain-containing protein n=1 Tax=Rhizoctonia solani TaxID=456999 RepID=A0A8H2WFW5_9AGAM|nr:unnamed protein product [Rhizoctonia solani]